VCYCNGCVTEGGWALCLWAGRARDDSQDNHAYKLFTRRTQLPRSDILCVFGFHMHCFWSVCLSVFMSFLYDWLIAELHYAKLHVS